MIAIAETLSALQHGKVQVFENLALFPLIGSDAGGIEYQLFEESLQVGCARVAEVSESGHVPELALTNDCDIPVLLLDGEELVGAKQNRILNLTILAPARTTTVIPVSCVEAGRWSYATPEFKSSKRAFFSSGRAKKAASVSASMRASGAHASDQAMVWDDIAEFSACMDVHSPTGAAEALHTQNRPALDRYLAAFHAETNQTGALFAINGRIVGIDLFDKRATYAKLLPLLIESYALDAIAAANEPLPETEESVPGFIESVANADVQSFPGAGLGQDARLQADRLTGGALLVDGTVVHLCAFRLPEESSNRDRHPGTSRITALSRRRRPHQ